MNQFKDFLLEIGTEELPPKRLENLVKSLAANLTKELITAKLTHSEITTFATPRRLAVLIKNLIDKQPDQEVELRGPAIKVAFDETGAPTLAATKFAASCGVEVNQLERLEDKKGAWLFHKTTKIGQKTTELLPQLISQSIKNLSIPKLMRWGEGKDSFVRPVHWIVMLYGNNVIECEILGVKASNKTHGHRFHHPESIVIAAPDQYEKTLLEKGMVIPSFNERKDNIRSLVTTTAAKLGTPLISDDLLTEVTGLVEWPVALVGSFDRNFLEVPAEALIASLQHQQRYFPLVDTNKKLLPNFVIISNIESKNPEQVVEGNERVIRARLTDAKYFYQQDLKFTLNSFVEKLKQSVFQAKLGSLYDKTQRLVALASFIAIRINANVEYTKRAAELAKADLMTTMVFEFPELQGIMGYYYALGQFEPEPIALAIKEHYLPRSASDELPDSLVGSALSIADRLDNLVGLFGINNKPTGEKDPFGLRRAAMGIIRIILEKKLPLNLQYLLQQAENIYQQPFENTEINSQVVDFIFERLRSWYLEQNNSDPRIFNAVLARRPAELLDFVAKLEAVSYFKTLPESEALSMAHKRVNNILQKSELKNLPEFNIKQAKETAEKELAQKVVSATEETEILFAQKKYKDALKILAEMKPAIDQFFDKVMVMVDDKTLRNNRLALLVKLRDLFIYVADLSLLA